MFSVKAVKTCRNSKFDNKKICDLLKLRYCQILTGKMSGSPKRLKTGEKIDYAKYEKGRKYNKD